MIIAIDGPAASGKGTLAKRLAAHYRLPHLDTGLLYRGVARVLLDRADPLEEVALATAVAASLDMGALDEARLRGREMGEAASVISAYPGVRTALLELQRRFAEQPGGAVLDGRDIGSVVCPGAEAKLFVTASPEERAARRHRELASRGDSTSFETVLADIRRRDERDSTRSAAPLVVPPGSVVLDTTLLDPDGALAAAVALVEGRLGGA